MNTDDVLLRVIEALDAAGVPYMLVGSFSSNYYGIPRSTEDADFVVELRDQPVTSLTPFLGPDIKLEAQMSFEGVTGTFRNVLNVVGDQFKIELFRLSSDPHDLERFRRRVSVSFLGRTTVLPTVEDVIITKLRWCRGKDRDDVRDVIAVQGKQIDWHYVHEWCVQHGTRQRLDEIRQSISPDVTGED